MKWIFAAALLTALPVGASTHVMSGNNILAICTLDDPTLAGACAGWVTGASEGFIAGAALPFYATGTISTAAQANTASSQTLGFCLPTEVANGQLLDVLVLYLQGHPESRHMPARGLYLIAAQEAFPCPLP